MSANFSIDRRADYFRRLADHFDKGGSVDDYFFRFGIGNRLRSLPWPWPVAGGRSENVVKLRRRRA